MNPTADRYAVVLWALREHHRRTKSWRATAADVGAILGWSTLSASRTLTGLVDNDLVWSSHTLPKEIRARRLADGGPRRRIESDLNRPALYTTSGVGDTVNDMLDLVGSRDHLGQVPA